MITIHGGNGWRKPSSAERRRVRRRLYALRKHDRTIVNGLLDVGIWFCAFMVAGTAMGGIERDLWLLSVMVGLIILSLIFKACYIGRGMLFIKVMDGSIDCVAPDREGKHHCTSSVHCNDVSDDNVTVLSCETCRAGQCDVLVAKCGRRIYGFCERKRR